MKKIDINNISYKFVSIVFLIFGFFGLFSSIAAARLTANYYNNSFGFTILYFFMFIIIIFLFYLFINSVSEKKHKIILSIILFFTFIIRLITVLIIEAEPASDFLFYQRCAELIIENTKLGSNYASTFPHTIGFSFIISIIYRIFGNNIVCIQIFNVICTTLTGFIIYKITDKLSNNKTGILSAFIFCIFPSGILYNELLATEPLFTLLFMTIIYLTVIVCDTGGMAVSSENGKNEKFNYWYLGLIGVIISVLNSVRPSGLVILLALCMLILFIFKLKLYKKIIAVFILLTVVFIGNKLASCGLSFINGQPVANSPFGYSFFVGANTKYYGAWNAPDADFADKLLNDPEISPDEFHKILLSEGAKRYINNGFSENLKFLPLKFGFLWGTDILVDFYLQIDPDFDYSLQTYKLGSLGNAFHLFLMLFTFFAAYGIFISKKRKNGVIFIFILVLGITCQHVLAEVMERYVYSAKVSLFPIVSMGFYMLFSNFYESEDFFMFKRLKEDIDAVLDRDPAARSGIEVFFLSPGIHALFWHRAAHGLYKFKFKFIANLISQITRAFTGIEIHPGAKIGHGVLIDHGMGVVIGETAEVGDGCTIYQNVTLGGTGKDTGKRHPTIGNNVLIGTGAKILGPFKVGDNSKIAANAVVLSEVSENSTCVGVPARVVIKDNVKVKNWQLDHTHMTDPVSQELCRLLARIEKLEKRDKKDETI